MNIRQVASLIAHYEGKKAQVIMRNGVEIHRISETVPVDDSEKGRSVLPDVEARLTLAQSEAAKAKRPKGSG